MRTVVAKFGGTSLADAKQFRKIKEIIAEDPLCFGVGGGKAGVKGIMYGMESFDDRAYVRVLAIRRCNE